MFWLLKGAGLEMRSGRRSGRKQGGSKDGWKEKYTWLSETVTSRGQGSRTIAIEGMSREGNMMAEGWDH